MVWLVVGLLILVVVDRVVSFRVFVVRFSV